MKRESETMSTVNESNDSNVLALISVSIRHFVLSDETRNECSNSTQSLFKFLHTTKQGIRDEHESDNDDADSNDVLPEIPLCVVCNTLVRQILRPF